MVISSNKIFIITCVMWITSYCGIYILVNRNKNIQLKREIVKCVFGIYMLYLISKVYFPLDISIGPDLIPKGPTIILSPLESLRFVWEHGGMDAIIYNFGGNFILLTPLTVFLAALDKNNYINIKSATVISLAITCFIETTQVILSLSLPRVGRYFEVSDLLLNTLGGTLGFIIYTKGEYYYKYLKEFIRCKLQLN